jgi:hypothetical protein
LTTGFKTRPTKDLDFLAEGISADSESIKGIFQKICKMKCDDGVSFDPDTIKTEAITEGADYEGIRINIISYLGKARKRLQLDIGFGDIIVPEPKKLSYPSLLNLGTKSKEPTLFQMGDEFARF